MFCAMPVASRYQIRRCITLSQYARRPTSARSSLSSEDQLRVASDRAPHHLLYTASSFCVYLYSWIISEMDTYIGDSPPFCLLIDWYRGTLVICKVISIVEVIFCYYAVFVMYAWSCSIVIWWPQLALKQETHFIIQNRCHWIATHFQVSLIH